MSISLSYNTNPTGRELVLDYKMCAKQHNRLLKGVILPVMEDHFMHNTFPPPQTPHRRWPIILAIVVILVLGVVAALYWQKWPFSFSSRTQTQAPEAVPLTLEEKRNLLQAGGDLSASSTTSQSPSLDAKKELLQNDTEDSAPMPQVSLEDKKKLLGSE